MRDGVIISLGVSFCLHLGLVVWGMTRPAEQTVYAPAPMVVLPIELLSISDETNVAAMTTRKPEEAVEDAREEKAEETPASASGAAAAPDTTEIEPADVPAPKASPAPKPSATPSRRPNNQRMTDAEFQRELDAMLQGNAPNRPAQQRNNAPTDINNLGDRNQQGYGNNRDNTATYAAYFSSQLKEKCWGDMDDAPDAHRLRAVIKVRFLRNGLLNGEPELVTPARQPAGDRPMLLFIQKAMRALRQCEPYRIPPEYLKDGLPSINLEFLP